MATIRGRVAVVKWAYFTAATIEGYAVTPDGKKNTGWSVTGTILPGADPFKLAQRPLFFVAPFLRGAWRWEIQTLTRGAGGGFSARLGPVTIEGGMNERPRPTT